MKSKSCSFLTMLALLAVVFPALAQVTNLGIAPAPGGQSVLYWPTSTTNYVLQITASLATPNWVTATNAVTVNAANVTNSAPAGYFRLRQSTNPPGMVLIPAGSFKIGNFLLGNFYNTATNDPDSPIADAIPTNVYVSAFYMDINLVTGALWASVYSYATGKGYTFDNVDSAKAGNNPVQNADWYDSVKWCNARSQQEGLTPVYYTDAGFTQVYKNGEIEITNVNWAANGYRLPTEAEWEKAARGGLIGNRFPWGNFISESQANYYGGTTYSYNLGFDLGPNGYNAIGSVGGTPYTSPVGSFAPNGYGLYDMAGNGFEWCWDWYTTTPYPAGSAYLGGTNPRGAGPSGARVLRGGSWASYAFLARCAYRQALPGSVTGDTAIRCVRGF